MPTLQTVREVGNQLVAYYDDGQKVTLYPAASGVYVRKTSGSVPQGGGGESGANGGTAGHAPGSVSALVDDYPWPNAPQDDLSPLRYSYRDCTDFVAWRINRDNGCTSAPWAWTWAQLRIQNGNAIGWRHDWQLHGWAVDVTCAPGVIGWYGTSAGAFGHVFYVQSVSGGSMTIEEYNWGGTQKYDVRTIPIPAIDSSHSFLSMP